MIKDETFKQHIIIPEREIIICPQFGYKKLINTYHELIQYLVKQ